MVDHQATDFECIPILLYMYDPFHATYNATYNNFITYEASWGKYFFIQKE